MDIVRRPYGSLANLFETSQLGVIVVNVRNMKGRKTDVKGCRADCRLVAAWVAVRKLHSKTGTT